MNTVSAPVDALSGGGNVLVEHTARAAETFVKDFYYHVADSAKYELYRFYRDDSIIIWNGTPKKGVASLNEFFKQLPPTKHTITSIDSHPIAGLEESGGSGVGALLVTAVGSVVYASDAPRGFSQSFLLLQETGKTTFYILSDTFRLN
eukprot:TRINITY_DN4554_c0_g1_i1.p1 TRINITY_DN4554_c0_g1~~TRINITY_DN4554_c0_g1_i1.p1  ORF type:complete len:148 (-),score=26.85 TRINITY_DN4554_c0_g1_i1:23-466(-)